MYPSALKKIIMARGFHSANEKQIATGCNPDRTAIKRIDFKLYGQSIYPYFARYYMPEELQ